MASTLNGTGVTFSDGSTQASGSALGGIGTFAWVWRSTITKIYAGDTISGSNLFYVSSNAASSGPGITSQLLLAGNRVNASATFTTTDSNGFSITMTSFSGTWRAVSSAPNGSYNSCSGNTSLLASLFVRVS